MSILSRLFGGGTKPETREEASETYKEFRIFAAPLLRADTLRSLEEAEAFSIRKAKQVIDEQGERIFS